MHQIRGFKTIYRVVFATCMLMGVNSFGSPAHAISVVWTGPSNNFNEATISFIPFIADTFDGMTDSIIPVAEYRREIGAGSVQSLEIELDGSFITLATFLTVGNTTDKLDAFGTGVSFARGTVSKLRLSSNHTGTEQDCVDKNECYRYIDGLEIGFSDSQSTIPEPSTYLLFGSGLLGLAGYRWHQRRREGSQTV